MAESAPVNCSGEERSRDGAWVWGVDGDTLSIVSGDTHHLLHNILAPSKHISIGTIIFQVSGDSSLWFEQFCHSKQRSTFIITHLKFNFFFAMARSDHHNIVTMVTCLPTLKSNKTLNKLKHLFWTSTWQFVPGIHWLSLELWSMVHWTKLEPPTLRPHDEDQLQVVSLVMVSSGDKLDLWELNWYWSMWISLCRNCFNFDGNSILWVLGFLTILSLICFSTASSLNSVLHHV